MFQRILDEAIILLGAQGADQSQRVQVHVIHTLMFNGRELQLDVELEPLGEGGQG